MSTIIIIQTHTHIDHVGALDEARHAPMLIAAAERALPKPLYWHGVQPLNWPDRNYVCIDDDAEIGPLFRIMLVPGHAPGQLAMMLQLPQTRTVLLTSDAISCPAESEPSDGSGCPLAQRSRSSLARSETKTRCVRPVRLSQQRL